jgi:RNA polymerase sigma factor (sigma-70 family)
MRAADSYTEQELIAMIRQNDKRGFDYLYMHYAAALSFVIGKIITDEHTAEDLLQEVFINIWANIHQYDASKSRLYTWMRNIATNKCLDFLRSSLHNMRKRASGNETDISTHNFKTEQKTDHIGVSQIVANLKSDHQSVIWMAYYRGHTLEEISNKLHLPIGTVKSRMRRALGIIRSEFAYAL